MLFSITGFKQLMADDDVTNTGCSRCWGAVDSETKKIVQIYYNLID